MTVIERPIEIYKKYDDDIIRHLQDILLDMFKDFIKICNDNDIKYFIHGGTNIGAVRHSGFIPWDDEIDVALFREDYERLLKILEKPNEKYYIYNWKYQFGVDEICYTPKTLFCLKNTRLKYLLLDVGIFIDLNVLDDIPENKIQKFMFIKTMDSIKFVMDLTRIIQCDLYISKNKERIGHCIGFLFKLFNIPNLFAKIFTKLIKRYEGKCGTVCSVGDTSYNLPIPKKYFNKITLVKFENTCVNMLVDYDKVLKVFYEDYMEIPPESERFNHNWEIIDFGEY